jgi:VanZ family protein
MPSIARPIRIALTLSFMGLLAFLSIVPGDPRPGDSAFVWLVAETPRPLQKSMHLILYGVLMLMLAWSFAGVRSRLGRFSICSIIAVGFGAALEWCQTMVPGRFGTLFDVLLDASGVALGLLAGLVLLGARERNASAGLAEASPDSSGL